MEGVQLVAELMVVAARTAPKAKGKDYLVVVVLRSQDAARLGKAMVDRERETNQPGFERDGHNVTESECVLLIGLKDARVLGLNCGACGSPACTVPNAYEGLFAGPNCALRLLDLGIAIGSAVKTSGLLNVDCRVTCSAGIVARQLSLIDADIAVGIPLSATGKNIYFDRMGSASTDLLH